MKNSISCSIFLCTLALLAVPLRSMGATAICHVVDPAGKPIAGAVVYSLTDLFQSTDVHAYTTDKSGNFTVSNVGGGRLLSFIVDAPGYAPGGGAVVPGENTFTLTLPTKLTGKVVDAKGLPVAGVTVCVQYALTYDPNAPVPEAENGEFFMGEPFATRYTVKTDSAGKYVLDDLPSNSQISVQLKDPRYISATVLTTKDQGEAPLLIAAPGASISGKVTRQDGKPIGEGIQLIACSDTPSKGLTIPSMAKIAADGTYTFTGLAPDTYTVSTSNFTKGRTLPGLVDPLSVKVTATIDTPGAASDLVFTSGGIVTGIVLDADTKKPVPNARVTFQNKSDAGIWDDEDVVTELDGKFSARVWVGQITVSADDEADDYGWTSNPQSTVVTPISGQIVTMDPILLKRSPSAAGVAVDDGGRPVPNIVLRTERVQSDGPGISIDPSTASGTGAFTIHRLVPGEFYIDAGADWTVLSPKTFTVPLTSPIKLVLKKNAAKVVLGTVVDTSNAPVAGVDLLFEVLYNSSTGSYNVNKVDVTSGADGTYTVPYASIDPRLLRCTKVTKDGYLLKSGADVSVSNDKLIISPVVMAQLGGRVSGTVLNGLGKPVADAWVFSPDSGDSAMLAQTDASGHFELSNLIAGSVNVYAAKGLFSSCSSVQASTSPVKSVVHLPAVPTPPIGTPNLTKVTVALTQLINTHLSKTEHLSEVQMNDEAAHIIAEVSPDDAVRFILATSSITTADLGAIASGKIYADPIGVASWALLPLKRMSDDEGRGETALTIGLAVAPYDAAAAVPYYSIAAQYVHFDHLDQNSIITAAKLTTMAYILQKPEADDDYAKVLAGKAALLKDAKTNPELSSLPYFLPQNLANIIALGNVDKAFAMLSDLPRNDWYFYAPGIVAELVKPNPTAAMAAYHWIEKHRDAPGGSGACDDALALVLPIIYKTDPKGAVARARTISDPGASAKALTDLADLMPPAEAAPLYQEAEKKVTSSYGRGYSPACIANHAWLRDQVLGAKLFKIARTKFTEGAADTHGQALMGPSYSDFAFYYSRIDPAYCRLLLEMQFAKNSSELNKNYGTDNMNMEADVAAMCAIDINRAAQMAGLIKDEYWSYTAGLKPPQYLLFTPQQRNTIPFAQWANTTDWVPGAIMLN